VKTMGVKAKLKKSSPKVLNAWLLFVTILVIVLSFLYYSFVFVKNNEEHQTANRFRVLAQMGKNIVEREKGFRGIVSNAVEEAKEKSDKGILLVENLRGKIKKANDSLEMDKKEPCPGNRMKFSYKPLQCKDKNGEVGNYYIYMNSKDFFDPLKRPDVFDQLIILQEGQNKEFDVLYHSFPGDIVGSKPGKLKNPQHGIQSGCLKEIEISNIKYKLFLQPVRLDSGENWYVGGFIADKKFRKESRKLRAGVIIPLLIVFFIFLLSIPIFKLFLMSRFEQLDISDVVLTTVSVNFGMIALLILCLYTFQVWTDTAGTQKNLYKLANQISKNFTDELKEAYEELSCCDSSEFLKEHQLNCGDNFKDILTVVSPGGDNFSVETIEKLKQMPPPSIYPFYKVVFWLDSSGQQRLQFSTRNYGGRLINVEKRKYFREPGNWRVPGYPDSKFTLESITSLTSGENLAAISIKSNLNLIDKEGKPFIAAAAAMTTQLKSVIDTIMPAGYGFCIIDGTGEVWFHSNSRKNHQENFIHEVGDNKALLSALSVNREKHLVLDYQDKTHQCFVMPVPDIPLYVVTFQDLRYTSALHIAIVLHIVLFFIAIALFIGLLFIVSAGCNYRKSLLKRKHVPFEWFRPLTKNKDAYQHLIVSNLVIVLFLILFKLFTTALPAETFFYCLSALLFSFTYNYYTIAGEDAGKYRLENRNLLVFFLVFVILLVGLAYVIILAKFLLVIGFQVVLFILLVLVKSSRSKFKPFRFLDKGGKRNWIRSYVLFLLSWLLVVGVIPIILFYLDVHSYENKVALRHFQAKLAQRIENRDNNIHEFYDKKMSNHDNRLTMWTKSTRKKSGRYADIIGGTKIENAKETYKSANTLDDSIFKKYADVLKLPLNRVAAERRAFVYPAASDNSFTWKRKDKKLILRYQKKGFPLADETLNRDDGYVYVESDMTYFKISIGFFLLLIVAAIFLSLVYFLVRFASRVVFGLNLPGVDNIQRTYNQAQDEIYDSIKAGSHVIVYCPGSIEMKCCEDSLKNSSGLEVHYTDKKGKRKSKKLDKIDLKSGSETSARYTESSEEMLIIIKNFELHLNDTGIYLDHVNLVLSLLRSRNVQVVVLASIPLEEIIEFYEEKLDEASSKEASNADKEMIPGYKKIIDGLNEINEGFLPMYVPVKIMDEDRLKDQSLNWDVEKTADTGIGDFIKKEFQAAEYFIKIIPGAYRYYKYLQKKDVPITEVREEMIIKIQELAQQYYNELLYSCSKKEKYILYDIAQDMFVNVNNLDAINTLLKKGLLVYDGEFKLMNESFRNFILSSINADELNQYVRILYPKWKSYKAPLLFIALGVAVFLAFQGDILGKVDALIATAVGGVAIVTNFSRVFLGYSKSSSK